LATAPILGGQAVIDGVRVIRCVIKIVPENGAPMAS